MPIPRSNFLSAYYCVGRWMGGTSHRGQQYRNVFGGGSSHRVGNCGQKVVIESATKSSSGRLISRVDRFGLDKRYRLTGSFTIGAKVMMGPDIPVMTHGHLFEDPAGPMRTQGAAPDRTGVIEDYVWLGKHVIVLPGVTIRPGTAIAVGAVATRALAPFSVIAGNRTRLVRNRG